MPIELEVEPNWKGGVHESRHVAGIKPIADDDAAHSTQKSQQQGFRERLPDQPRAAGAQSGPKAHLPLPGRGARQQNIGHVHARQQQHQRGQNQKERRDYADHIVCLRLWARQLLAIDAHRDVLVGGRVLFRQARGDDVHGTLRLGEADTWLQPRHHAHHPGIASAHDIPRRLLQESAAAERQIAIQFHQRHGADKLFGHYPDDDGRFAIQANQFSDHARIAAKSLLPIGVSENQHRSLSRLILFARLNQTAQHGLHLQSCEVIAGHIRG